MKHFLAIFYLILSISSYAQKPPKIDFDDDMITIDKIKKYDFVVTKKGGFTSLEASKILNLAGEVLFIIKDTTLYLDQLENELEKKREFVQAHIFIAPKLNKTAYVNPIMLTKARGTVFRDLKKTDFFNSEGQDTLWFNHMVEEFGGKEMMKKVEEYNLINAARKVNAQKTAEKFGPMLKRKPATIQSSTLSDLNLMDGGKRLAILKKDNNKSGKHSTTYDIINHEKKVIGRFYHQHTEFTGNIVTDIDANRKYFTFDRLATMDVILTTINEYLIYYGYL